MVRRRPTDQTPEPEQPTEAQSEESSVYARGQTVIPKMIREAAAIDYGTRLHWEVREGVIHVIPIPKDPVRAARGLLKGKGYTFAEFMKDRQLERARELAEDEQWLREHSESLAQLRRRGLS